MNNCITSIFVKLSVEGIHSFPGVVDTDYDNEVWYLKNSHRHRFGIKCYDFVSHDDRDKEFICLKHRVEEYLKAKFWDSNWHVCDFGYMSCEKIAKDIMEQFGFYRVEVDEDGENGAIVEDFGSTFCEMVAKNIKG